MPFRSRILKMAIFATGLSGIVAEYILSTLATYFLGDSVMQWTLIVSIMMFSMGLGSRISKYFQGNLLQIFIFIEFALSLVVAYSSIIAYTAAAFTIYTGAIIYTLSILIGLMIGMEIPLVIRLNNSFEILRVNISSVMEQDYYGSLAGGLFFAFIGLPYLGITFTPFVLGMINFVVALSLFFILRPKIKKHIRISVQLASIVVGATIILGFFVAEPIILFGEQKKYKDKVIFEEQSRYQKIVMTQWKDNYWLFINGNQQLSTLDEAMYHEPMVHPVMKTVQYPQQVLILGGGDGCAAREVLKYKVTEQITLVDLDPVMTELGKNHPVMVEMNENALNNARVSIVNKDAYKFLSETNRFYDVIIIDLPDPKTIELGRMYSKEFYRLCYKHLRPGGAMVTQAGSPYFATRAFRCIDKTVAAAGFETVQLHNQILTLGEWGWIMGVKEGTNERVKAHLHKLQFDDIETHWINNEAMKLITSFGKDYYGQEVGKVEVNKIHNPVLYKYYLNGNWDLY
ncbi:MAG TPA: polyamine aminopropyltransferase [Salinivirga sp.]|uniref:polyamine aminopropyltransferase n=1 Tax=Salinivirga sp. TaxID=1970192 RepID=UPI002B4A6F7C|nr:polyamine aminopropyltransferase [Salinivirga sp.]HKK59421.1 polyamine aminopropyltransferase [Salinivirga sp.]